MEPIRKLNLRLFDDAGSLVNTTIGYRNAYTGALTPFSTGTDDLTPTMKTYYKTGMLKNARPKLVYAQLGKKQALPSRNGRTVEWRKVNTLPDVPELTEGVIPVGEKGGMTAITVSLTQYGMYVAISDLLELHATDPILTEYSEELGATGGKTNDKLVRNVLLAGTNILFADAYNGTTYASKPSTKAELLYALNTSHYTCDLTPDMINQGKTILESQDVPAFDDGCYVMVIHPHVAYSIRKHPDFQEAVKYQAAKRIFRGEIGELWGVRFLVTTQAPIIKGSDDGCATYKSMMFGKDAFGVIDVEGGGMETIYMDREKIGGPLKQFSTIGIKFEMAAKILYQERMLTIWSGAKNFQDTAVPNVA
jgi:N4-gp56 family major capsid protein